ncbi:phosphopantetheine-binding protein [Streptomyces sp. NPDC050560]|uniref:phosphopantetheine-binding protein n=1 Tax=Streptomyces sp. NPDC050560 TaxID=3365630 RepID=UPI00378FBAF2
MTSHPVEPAPGHPAPDPSPAPHAPPLDPEELRASVARMLDRPSDSLGDHDNLVALGVDSVKVMAISAGLRRHRVRISFARMIEEPTLAAWWRLIGESADGPRAAR